MCALSTTINAGAPCLSGNKLKTSGYAYPPTQRKSVFRVLYFYYSFSIFVLLTTTTTFSSLIALAKCDQLPARITETETTGSTAPQSTTTLGARIKRSAIVFEDDTNTDYSYPIKSTIDIGGSGGVSGGDIVYAPTQLLTPHEHLAAFGYRTKQKPQQFFPREDDKIENVYVGETSNELASFNLVNIGSGAREDICNEHCICSRSPLIAISCDFQANRDLSEVFGSNFQVPSEAKSIKIKLAPSTQFRLESGFFNGNNKVNSLTIEGSNSEREQVEITTDAFRGNNGPNLEILMQNVFSVIVRSKAFAASGIFTVRNSNDLIIYPNAFENAQLNGFFVGINDLRISEKAFNSALAYLRIESSHIDNIYRFEASLREIRFINCTIGTINTGAFDVISINSIIFKNCRIDAIKARAITEKLQSKHVSITSAIIGSIESEAIYGSGISELILTKSKIDKIQANAIHVTAINATIAENHIKHLENNWLRVKDWSNIRIEKNQFGHFGSMELEETKQPVTCHFYSNSLTNPLPGSLNITNHYCYMREISINMPCRCNLEWLSKLSARDLRSEVYCTIDTKLGLCFNSTTFNLLKYLNEVCDENKKELDCVANRKLKQVDGKFFTPEELAADDHMLSKLLFIIGGCVLLLLLVTILILIICRCWCRANKNQTNSMTMPNVRNHLHQFSNEELRIIEQTMQMLQKKYPELQKKANAQIQVLLQENLSDTKCVKTITQIVELLNMTTHQSLDFLAFNQVLTQHLQPPPQLPLPNIPTQSTTDPIYSEPTLRDVDVDAGTDGFYTSSTIVPMSTEGYMGQLAQGGAQTHLPEHIYAEPNCAQQPLLRNEYASPADRNLDSLDVYTEPINERVPTNSTNSAWIHTSQPQQTQQRLPPYAIPTTARNKAEPFPSYNFPDVINNQENLTTSKRLPIHPASDKPLTNVQRIAQDLQGMPKFQLNLNRPQNFHLLTPPVYTAPDVGRKKQIPIVVATPQLATPERDEDFEMDMRGAAAADVAAAAIPSTSAAARGISQLVDSSSDHSGGSNETVKIDDIIEYVDA